MSIEYPCPHPVDGSETRLLESAFSCYVALHVKGRPDPERDQPVDLLREARTVAISRLRKEFLRGRWTGG